MTSTLTTTNQKEMASFDIMDEEESTSTSIAELEATISNILQTDIRTMTEDVMSGPSGQGFPNIFKGDDFAIHRRFRNSDGNTQTVSKKVLQKTSSPTPRYASSNVFSCHNITENNCEEGSQTV